MSATKYPAGMRSPVDYPDCDGKPMSDNTLQFDWIGLLKWNAEAQYAPDPAVFVAGDHLIYPVEGDPKTRQAPDAYVAFGRPKGHRGSYKVWAEDDLFPQVVFEVWSPNNRKEEMDEKFAFYEKFGAEEYYIVYPEFPAHADGWVRSGDKLSPVETIDGFVSPRLGWQFQVGRGQVRLFGPDGRELRTPDVVFGERVAAEAARDAAERQKADAERAKAEADQQRTTAEQAKADADRQRDVAERDKADAERQKAEADRQRDAERERAARLAAKLRELGIDPDAV